MRLYTSNKLLSDAAIAMSLQGTGKAVAFLASTHAMRSLGPQELGSAALVLSIVAQAGVISDLGLNVVGVRALGNDPDRRDEIISLVWGIRLRFAIVISFLMLVGVWIYQPNGGARLWVLGAPLLIVTALNPQWIFQGIEQVPRLNFIQLIQTLLVALLYATLFHPGVKAEVYVTVFLVTQFFAWILSYSVLRRQFQLKWRNFDWNQAWQMVRSSRHAFAIVLTVFVYTGLEIPMITFFLSPDDAGIYRAAQGIVGALMPILLIPPLLLYPRLIVWRNTSDIEFMQKVRLSLVVLLVFACALGTSSFIWVPLVFEFLLDQRFHYGVLPAILLVIAKSIVLLGNVFAWGLHAYDLDKKLLWITLFVAVTSVSLNLALIPVWGIIAASAVNLISEVLITTLSVFVLYRIVATRIRSAERHVL